MKIPNKLTVPAAVTGIGFHAATSGWSGLWYALTGLGTGFAILFILYVFRAVGAGDVKLFGAIGALTGMQFTLQSIMYSIIYAGFIGMIIILMRWEVLARIRRMFGIYLTLFWIKNWQAFKTEETGHLRFPFMYAVLPGALTAYFYM